MAKVHITLEDTERGTVSVSLEFDPPLAPNEPNGKPGAQYAANTMLKALERVLKPIDTEEE